MEILSIFVAFLENMNFNIKSFLSLAVMAQIEFGL